MSFASYRETRPWAKSILQAVLSKKMPPWFADPGVGHFANDPSLGTEEIEVLRDWVKEGAAEGPANRPAIKKSTSAWSLGTPDAILEMPHAFVVPKSGEIDYQYVVVATGFTEDRWVDRVELLPGNRAAVHHAVVYLREPGSSWLKDRAKGTVFTMSASEPDSFTTSDILFTYTPGAPANEWPAGMAKLIKAGSDLVFQLHYTAVPHGGSDRTRIGLVFSKRAPQKRVLTLQLNNDRFVLPPGAPNVEVSAWGTLPNDALLLSFFPHMHLRGSKFEYRMVDEKGVRTSLLRVGHYDFHWQLTYRLKDPLFLRAGTRLECTGTFDNSRGNPRNPDPGEAVRFGFQSHEEMMIGFFDVAVPSNVDKPSFFVRH